MSKGWHVRARQFVLPKEGSAPEECEDAVGVNVGALRFAVADGATEAFDARTWAARLADSWVGEAGAPLAAEEFRAWLAEQGERLHASWDGRRLPWYAEEKRRAGSYAAFVGLRLSAGGAGRARWAAAAVGDSCLVQRRGAELLAALPVSDPAAFGACPPLVPSSAALREAALGRLVTAGGEARPGDVFLLMSDALAAWYLEAAARRGAEAARFDALLEAGDGAALAEFVRRERAAGRMKDDDVAAVRVLVEEG